MKKIFVLAFAAMLFCTAAGADDSTPQTPYQRQTISSTIDGGRYEILTSGIPDHKRYRLDKQEGTVWMFYYGYSYTEIKREASDQDVKVEGQNNYQLYVMGDGSNAYLMNVNTGIIWYYEWHLFKDDEFLLMKK